MREETSGTRRPRPAIVRRLERHRAEHRDRHPVYRAAFVVAGAVVLLGGLAMLVLPGPALVVIPIGLAMLSLEFAWAAALLDKALHHADLAKDKAAQTSALERVLVVVAALAGVAGLVTLAVLYDIPWLPV